MFTSLIARIVKFFVSIFVHEATQQIIDNVNKPDTTTNEDNTDKLKSALDDDLNKRLSNKSGDSATIRGGEIS